MDVQNWPWDPNNNRSYVLVDFMANPTVRSTVNVSSGSDGLEGYVSMISMYSSITLYAAHSYILDQEPFLPDLADITENYYTIGPVLPPDVAPPIKFRQQLCSEVLIRRQGSSLPDIYTPTLKWTNASYDPTFVTLFSDFGSSPQSPQVNTVRIAVGVTLGVVAAIIIIIVITVPVVKYVVRPYARRADQKSQNGELLKGSASNWSAGTKPKNQ